MPEAAKFHLVPTNRGEKLPGMETFPKNSLKAKTSPVNTYLPGLREEGSREKQGWQEAWFGLHGMQNLRAQGWGGTAKVPSIPNSVHQPVRPEAPNTTARRATGALRGSSTHKKGTKSWSESSLEKGWSCSAPANPNLQCWRSSGSMETPAVSPPGTEEWSSKTVCRQCNTRTPPQPQRDGQMEKMPFPH